MSADIERPLTYEDFCTATALVSSVWGGVLFLQLLSVVALPVLAEFSFGSPGVCLALASELMSRRTIRSRFAFPLLSIPFAIASTLDIQSYLIFGISACSMIVLLLFIDKSREAHRTATAAGDKVSGG